MLYEVALLHSCSISDHYASCSIMARKHCISITIIDNGTKNHVMWSTNCLRFGFCCCLFSIQRKLEMESHYHTLLEVILKCGIQKSHKTVFSKSCLKNNNNKAVNGVCNNDQVLNNLIALYVFGRAGLQINLQLHTFLT